MKGKVTNINIRFGVIPAKPPPLTVVILSLYRSFLTRLSNQELSYFSSALSSLARLNLAQVFESDKTLFKGAAQWLQSLSKLKTSEAQEIQSVLNQTLGQDTTGESGFDQIWVWVTRHCSEMDSKVLKMALSSLKNSRLNFTEKDRIWIQDFATQNGFQQAYDLLKDSSFKSFVSLLKEIRLLSQKGVIREGMSLLSRIDNERMQEVATHYMILTSRESLLRL